MSNMSDPNTSRKTNAAAESRKLSFVESDWNLPGSCDSRTTQTRHGGQGHPNLRKKGLFDSSTSEEDDAYGPSSSESETDGVSKQEAEKDYPESRKLPATRVMLEVGLLTKLMDELCKCLECEGPLNVAVKTICIASHVKVTCMDRTCGYILHGNPPAATTVHEKNNDNYNGNADYAINVLYVLGMICNGDGSTEAARMLGLMGLPNDTTMDEGSFHIIEERIGPTIRALTDEILLENLIEEVQLSCENESNF